MQDAITTTRYQSDAVALDAIHALLDGREWTVDTLNEIAAAIESTGRIVRDPCDIEE